MDRTDHAPAGEKSLHGLRMLEPGTNRSGQTLGWWRRLTTPPEPQHATFVQRERVRRAHQMSIITFFLILIDLLLIPATLFIPNHYVVFLCLFVLAVSIIAVLCNRANKVLFASFLLVIMLMLTLIAIVASTIPFDIGNLPLYDLLSITVLFAASLLPAPYIFVTVLFNVAFISGELFFQKSTSLATPALHAYLQTQFYAALARPLALQIIVGAVIFLWVRSTTAAITRADRAEMIAHLEHTLAQQKQQLETGIQQILQTHAEIANGKLDARTPIVYGDTLWPLANALNTLLTRFQRTSKLEQDTQKVLPQLIRAIQIAEQTQQSLPHFPSTSTYLDPLLVLLSDKRVSRSSAQDMGFRE